MNVDSHSQEAIPLLLHIPKCGGTTLSSCLYEMCSTWEGSEAEDGYLVDGVYYYPDGFDKDMSVEIPPHIRRVLERDDLRAITGHFSFGIHEFVTRPASYITILRDPVDRVVSLYYHNRRYRDRKLHEIIHSRNIDLVGFVRNLGLREIDNDQCRRISGIEPPFGKCSEEMLERACENLQNHFAITGVLDRFDEVLVLLKRAFAWKRVPVYQRGLVNEARPAREELSDAETETVLEHNQLDQRLYAYAEQLLEDRVVAAGDEFPEEVEEFQASNKTNRGKHRERSGKKPTRQRNHSPGSQRKEHS